jgi:hypothetical protein
MIHTMEKLETDRDRYKYYLPVLKDGNVLGNLVISIDFKRFFSGIFASIILNSTSGSGLSVTRVRLCLTTAVTRSVIAGLTT